MNNDDELSYKIKIKFCTAPDEPNQYQLENIKRDIKDFVDKGITPSHNDWAQVVKNYCPQSGTYFYRGMDSSDLSTLLILATKK